MTSGLTWPRDAAVPLVPVLAVIKSLVHVSRGSHSSSSQGSSGSQSGQELVVLDAGVASGLTDCPCSGPRRGVRQPRGFREEARPFSQRWSTLQAAVEENLGSSTGQVSLWDGWDHCQLLVQMSRVLGPQELFCSGTRRSTQPSA